MDNERNLNLRYALITRIIALMENVTNKKTKDMKVIVEFLKSKAECQIIYIGTARADLD